MATTQNEKTRDVPATIDEGYERVKDLIYHQVLKFYRRYGGDWNELVGQANLAFVEGHHQYTRGYHASGRRLDHSYATEIRRCVWFDMFDMMRARISCRARAATCYLEHEPEDTLGQDVFTLVDDLSDDGRYVASLVISPPSTIEIVAMEKGGTPRNFRSTVREHLEKEGWGATRIRKAFDEIKEALG